MTTATIEAPTNPTNLADLTDKDSAVRAVNQLLAVVVGSKLARATDSLKDEPRKRVETCTTQVLAEYAVTAAALASDPSMDKEVRQIQRKLDSLRSLAVMANVLSEVDWD